MKRLYVLRHAEAATGGFADFDRPLTAKGLNDAEQLGRIMKDKKYRPDHIICSPALRTRQTLQAILKTAEKTPAIDYEKIIYEGGVPDLQNLVANIAASCNALLIVGHNPSIHHFVFGMAAESGNFIDRLNTGYPPATLSVLEGAGENWADMCGGRNELVDLLISP